MARRETPWPHAPEHRLGDGGTYFVTAGTYQKVHHFQGKFRLEVLHRGLLTVARDFDWQLEAWAVFSNHYHFVARSPRGDSSAESLSAMLSVLHARTAKWLNKLDERPQRQVWHNYWETRLTYEKSYLARLSYTHQNAVKHGLVRVAHLYPWCSAAWFERVASCAQVKAIYDFGWNRVNISDAYESSPDW